MQDSRYEGTPSLATPSEGVMGDAGMTTIETPLELVTSVADLRFPPKIDAHLQTLMDRSTEGKLSEAEREELEALVELSEMISLLRVQALQVLGRTAP
jgi:hypothetical protein